MHARAPHATRSPRSLALACTRCIADRVALRYVSPAQAAEKASQHAEGAKESAQKAAAGTQERAHGIGEVRDAVPTRSPRC